MVQTMREGSLQVRLSKPLDIISHRTERMTIMYKPRSPFRSLARLGVVTAIFVPAAFFANGKLHATPVAYACTGEQELATENSPDGVVNTQFYWDQCTSQLRAVVIGGAQDTNAAVEIYAGFVGSGTQIARGTTCGTGPNCQPYIAQAVATVRCDNLYPYYAYGATDHNGSRDGTNAPRQAGGGVTARCS